MSRRKVNRITIYDYIAEKVPANAHFLINKFGKYRRARNSRELAYQLKDFVRTFGENGLRELCKIHPDKKLIELDCNVCKNHTCKPIVKEVIKEVPVREKTPNPQVYYNASGEEAIIKQNTNEGKVFIFLGFVILAVAILYKK